MTLLADVEDVCIKRLGFAESRESRLLLKRTFSCLSVREDVASAHGSECETAPAPSISITPSMDSKDIVEQLLMLDPEKANAIANLIKRRQSSNKRRSGTKQVSLVSADYP